MDCFLKADFYGLRQEELSYKSLVEGGPFEIVETCYDCNCAKIIVIAAFPMPQEI